MTANSLDRFKRSALFTSFMHGVPLEQTMHAFSGAVTSPSAAAIRVGSGNGSGGGGSGGGGAVQGSADSPAGRKPRGHGIVFVAGATDGSPISPGAGSAEAAVLTIGTAHGERPSPTARKTSSATPGNLSSGTPASLQLGLSHSGAAGPGSGLGLSSPVSGAASASSGPALGLGLAPGAAAAGAATALSVLAGPPLPAASYSADQPSPAAAARASSRSHSSRIVTAADRSSPVLGGLGSLATNSGPR
jgi:hypothetical protein